MLIYEIGTGYTPIPAQVAAATESVVEELTKAFSGMGQPVKIIDISAKDRAPNDLPINEVKVPSVFSKSDVSLGLVHKLKRVVYSVCLAFELKKILKKANEKSVLHFHNQYNLFFFTKLVPSKLRSKAVIAYTNHNGMWSLPWENVKDTLRKRYFQEIDAMKSADIVFVLNAATKKTVGEQLEIDSGKLVLIGNGVNTEIYRPLNEKEKAETKEKYNLSGKKVILQVGSVYENKGQARVCEVLAPILKENPDCVYAFAGGIVSQEYYEHTLKTASAIGIENQVRYLGSAVPGEEMNRLYNIANLTVFASEYEGFPLVCVESVSAGVPVAVCSELSVNIGDGCINGATAKEITELVSDSGKLEALSLAARKNAAENFTWQAVAKKYSDSFNR